LAENIRISHVMISHVMGAPTISVRPPESQEQILGSVKFTL